MMLKRFDLYAPVLVVLTACSGAERGQADSPEAAGGEVGMQASEQGTQASGEQAPPPQAGTETPAGEATKKLEAEAKIQPATGTKLKGEANFTGQENGVKVTVHVENAPPGRKGIHIHERGDCSDPKAKSMGEHFAPGHPKHGLPAAGSARHLGDLGNIVIGGDGKGHLEITVPEANLRSGDAMSFIGKAIVIHENEDTGAQPSGDSGAVIACGRIESK